MDSEAALLRRVFEAGAAIRSSAEVHAQMTERVADAVAQQLAALAREKNVVADERARLEQERQSLEAMRALLHSEMSDEAPAAASAASAVFFPARSRELQCHAGADGEAVPRPGGAFFLGYAVALEQPGPARVLSAFWIASNASAYQLFVDGAAVAVRVAAAPDPARPGLVRVDLVQVRTGKKNDRSNGFPVCFI